MDHNTVYSPDGKTINAGLPCDLIGSVKNSTPKQDAKNKGEHTDHGIKRCTLIGIQTEHIETGENELGKGGKKTEKSDLI